VGEIAARLGTVADWRELNRDCTILSLADGQVRGVLPWTVLNTVNAAREEMRGRAAARALQHLPVA